VNQSSIAPCNTRACTRARARARVRVRFRFDDARQATDKTTAPAKAPAKATATATPPATVVLWWTLSVLATTSPGGSDGLVDPLFLLAAASLLDGVQHEQ